MRKESHSEPSVEDPPADATTIQPHNTSTFRREDTPLEGGWIKNVHATN